MDEQTSQIALLLDLDSRHDDLLARLETLDKQVEKVLADCLTVRQPEGGAWKADGGRMKDEG